MDYKEEDKPIVLPKPEEIPTGAIQHFKEFSAGAGSSIFKANAEGVFIGGAAFADAPISFTYAGVQKILTGGKLQVGNNIVIDATGLNSVNNFISDTLFDATDRTPTSTTFTDIPGASMTSFVLTRSTRIITYIRANSYHTDYDTDAVNSKIFFQLVDTFDSNVTDGFSSGGQNVIDNINFAGTSWSTHISGLELVSISNDLYVAGTHSFKAQYRVSAGTGNLFELQIGYVLLGI